MTVRRIDHVGVVVGDLPAATRFFVEALGFELRSEWSVEDERVDRIVGLTDVRADNAMLQTPDGHGRIELSAYRAPSAQGGEGGAAANVPGLRHLALEVDDVDAAVARVQAHGGELVGDVVSYGGSYRLCYVRGPDGIILELAERTAP